MFISCGNTETTYKDGVVSLDTCVERFRKFTLSNIGKALLCATLHPAKVLSRHDTGKETSKEGGRGLVDVPIGVLEVGATANIIMVNDELDVLQTFIGGRLAFQKK